MPADVRQLYSLADGFLDYESFGESLLSLWSIDRILRDPWREAGTDNQGVYHDLAFADAVISSWYVGFRVRHGREVRIFAQGPMAELESLSHFLALYLTDPNKLGL